MEWTSKIKLNWIFNKGFVADDNNINTSIEYGITSNNTRNGIWTVRNRKWYDILQTIGTAVWQTIKNIATLGWKLLVHYNWKLFQSDSALTLYTDKGSVSTWTWTAEYGSTIKTIGEIAIISNGWNLQYFDSKSWTLKTTDKPYNDIGLVWETEDTVWEDLKLRWTTAVANDSNSVVIAGASPWYLYKSTDNWETFTQKWISAWYSEVCMNHDGSVMYAISYIKKSDGGSLAKSWVFKSVDLWNTWTKVYENNGTYWRSISCSSDGSIVYIAWDAGDGNVWKVLKSTNSGSTWSEIATWKNFIMVRCDWFGQKVIVSVYDGKCMFSVNSWTTFSEVHETRKWTAVHVSRDWNTILIWNAEWDLYRTDNDFIAINLVLNSKEYTQSDRPQPISWISSANTWVYVASVSDWITYISYNDGQRWWFMNTEQEAYSSAFISYNWTLILTTTFNWYIKRSMNTITFNPNTIEIHDRRLWIGWYHDKKSVMLVSQSYEIDERDLLDFYWDLRRPVVSVREWDIIGLKSTQNNLYLFDTTWVQMLSWYGQTLSPVFTYVDRNTIAMSHKTIVSADSMLFLLTKDKKIKTIWYVPGITNPVVWELSKIAWKEIQDWLTENLDDDQPTAFAYFYDIDKTVKFHCRTNWASHNDVVIVYDMVNQTFHIDTGKSFSCEAHLDWKTYVWSDSDWKVFQDETGWSDNDVSIAFKRETKSLDFWDNTVKKILRAVRVWWMINLTSNITMKIYADDNLVHTSVINSSQVSNSVVWVKTENKLYTFRYEVSKWNLYARWYTFRIVFEANWDDLWIILGSLQIEASWVGDLWKVELYEK